MSENFIFLVPQLILKHKKENMLRVTLFCLLSCFLFSGCGDDDNNSDASGTLTGKVRGVDFTFGSSRYGDIFDSAYNVIIYNAGPNTADSCGFNTQDVTVTFKPAQSTERVDMNVTGPSTGPNTLSFIKPGSFMNTVVDRSGYYQIIEENENTLVIEMDIDFNDDNFLKGTFTATKCF